MTLDERMRSVCDKTGIKYESLKKQICTQLGKNLSPECGYAKAINTLNELEKIYDA